MTAILYDCYLYWTRIGQNEMRDAAGCWYILSIKMEYCEFLESDGMYLLIILLLIIKNAR